MQLKNGILNITYSVYANRKVPDTWKNKMNYSNDMLNMLSKDTSLIKYLGKGNAINQKRPVTAKERTFKSSVNKVRNDSGLNSITEKEETSTNRTVSFYSTNKKEIDDKEILAILEDFRNAYPIKEKTHKEEEKNSTKNNNKSLYGISFGSLHNAFGFGPSMKKTVYGGINAFTHMRKQQKQRIFQRSIYAKILPEPSINIKTTQRPSSAINSHKDSYCQFLNSSSIEPKKFIQSPLIQKELESINFFGPYYSYCPPCSNRNIDYYNNLPQNKCIDMINVIKKAKRPNSVKRPVKSKNI